jgi:hypothetical protein
MDFSQLIKPWIHFVIRWLTNGGRSLANLAIVLTINICVLRSDALPQVFGALPSGVCSSGIYVPIGFSLGTMGAVAGGSYIYRRASRRSAVGRTSRYVAAVLIASIFGLAYWVDQVQTDVVSENVSKYADSSPAHYKLIVFPSRYQNDWYGKPTENWHDRWATDVTTKIEASDDLKRKANNACKLLRELSGLRIFLWSATIAAIAIISIELLYAFGKKNSPARSRSSKRANDSEN